MSNTWFQFKQFTIRQDRCVMKVDMDGVLLGAQAKGGRRILDVGTGTGLIVLMIAQRYAASFVEALEIDRDAYRQAKVSIEASLFAGRVRVRGVALQQLESVKQLGSIVSDPLCFVEDPHSPDVERSIARHSDTLSCKALCQSAYQLLTNEGEMSMVLPVESIEQFSSTAMISGFYPRKKYLIKTVARRSPKRYLMA